MPNYKKNPIEYLVFEGGGVKGFAYLGVISVLEKHKLLKNVKGVAGSSIGAFVAMLLASGNSYKEIKKIVMKLDLNQYMDGKFGSNFAGVIGNLYGGYGRYKGDKLKDYIGGLLEDKLGSSDITFAEFYEKTGMDLVLTGANLSTRSTSFFSKKTFPDMEVKLAVRISMSFPFFFDSVKFNNHIYIDGGLLNNYPLDAFEDDGDGIIQGNILGCKLFTDNEEATERLYTNTDDINSIVDFGMAIMNTMSTDIERLCQKLTDKKFEKTIVIDTGDISTLDVSLSNGQKMFLIKNGKEAADDYFD